MPVHAVDEALETRNAIVRGDDQLGTVREARGMEAGGLDDDEASATPGAGLVVGDEVLHREVPFRGKVGLVTG